MFYKNTTAGNKIYKLDHQDGGLDYYIKLNIGRNETVYLLLPETRFAGELATSFPEGGTMAVNSVISPISDIENDTAIATEFLATDFNGPFTAFQFIAPNVDMPRYVEVRCRIIRN